MRLCAGHAATKHASENKTCRFWCDLSPLASLAQMAHCRALICVAGTHRIVVVGDGAPGRRSLLLRFPTQPPPSKGNPVLGPALLRSCADGFKAHPRRGAPLCLDVGRRERGRRRGRDHLLSSAALRRGAARRWRGASEGAAPCAACAAPDRAPRGLAACPAPARRVRRGCGRQVALSFGCTNATSKAPGGSSTAISGQVN